MRKFYIVVVLSLLPMIIGKAATLVGKVSDIVTGDYLTGSRIFVKELNTYVAAGLDGSYRIKGIPCGSYTLVCSFVGYETTEKSVTVTTENAEVITNIQLNMEIKALDEVTITGTMDKESDSNARSHEKNAPSILNIVSAKAIELSPDLTVANVVQRVSGVSIERNTNGDGQYAILRGMDKRYNYTLINGVKIPGTDNKYRYIPLNIFPSELMERLEVTKALTPDMEGDAIGGAVNMVMKDAPERFMLKINAAVGYSSIFADRAFRTFDYKATNYESPSEVNGSIYKAKITDFSKEVMNSKDLKNPINYNAGITVGHRFFKKKVGIMLAGTYLNQYKGSNSLYFDVDDVSDESNEPVLSDFRDRKYSEINKQYGLHGKLDFQPIAGQKIQLYYAKMDFLSVQVRETEKTELGTGYEPDLGNRNYYLQTRSRQNRQTLTSATLQGSHKILENLTFKWSGVSSKAGNQTPERSEFTINGNTYNFKDTTLYFKQEQMIRRWEHNSDEDVAGYASFTFEPVIAGTKVEFSTGGLFRDKKRSSYFIQYQFLPVVNTSDHVLRQFRDWNDVMDVQWTVVNPTGSSTDALNYDASEKITAWYGQTRFTIFNTQVTGGLRAENTDQGYHLKYPKGDVPQDSNQVYTDYLPSIHLKYSPLPNHNIRASYFKSVNRPGFLEIVPYIDVFEDYIEKGNYQLKHTVADNFDFRYEWFPRPASQILAGIFYKRITNPIEYCYLTVNKTGDLGYMPVNLGAARNYGSEIDIIWYFRMWGIKANYTFTQSEITTPKEYHTRDENGSLTTISKDQTRPLQNQAAHVANFTLMFKDEQHGWDAQIATSYTGKRIYALSAVYGNDQWQKGYIQMDASAEKKFRNGLSLFAKATNLLNTPMEVYIDKKARLVETAPHQDMEGKTLVRRYYYMQTALLGIRYNLK